MGRDNTFRVKSISFFNDVNYSSDNVTIVFRKDISY